MQCFGPAHQLLFFDEPFRQKFWQLIYHRDDIAQDSPHLHTGEAFCFAVFRYNPRSVYREVAHQFDRRVHDSKAPITKLVLAGYKVFGVALGLFFAVGLVEPHEPYATIFVTGNCFGDVHAAPHIMSFYIFNNSLDSHHTRLELLSGFNMRKVIVAPREIQQQVLYGVQTKRRKLGCDRRAYTFYIL